MSTIELGGLQTESRNSYSQHIDQVNTTELCQIINNEDAGVSAAVERCIPSIAAAIDSLVSRCRQGGRVIYVGAGTSGRLGVLDASEIPPTYSASSEQFIALIAGGDAALRYAQEGAEDDIVGAENDLKSLKLNGDVDSLVGIAASGRTPYVLSCLSFAKSLGCNTIGIACSEPSAMGKGGDVDHMVSIVTGPEVVTGSTRMKAGTATKLALNMLSTGVMIKLGKTYGNMMIDLKATNKKLQQRSRDIIRTICGPTSPSSDEELDLLLVACDGSVKLAAATILLGTSVEEAGKHLNNAGGVLAEVLNPSTNKESCVSNGCDEGPGDYVLCVDGGGSKCAAVLMGRAGQIGRGEGGQCNVTNVGFQAAMYSISLAIQRAVDSCPTTEGKTLQTIKFRKVWIGLAGHDRPNIARQIDAIISQQLNLRIGKELRVSSDIELLVTTVANQHQTDSVLIMVAGTGSVAMSYEREGDHFNRTGRAGGWGYLLGDDGSGYDVGRQGVRVALQASDEIHLGQNGAEAYTTADPLVSRVFENFGIYNPLDPGAADLLEQVLAVESSPNQQQSSMAKRIAQVAKVVLDTFASSDKAKNIVENATQCLVDNLLSLLQRQDIKSSASSLILAGGLMQNVTFQKLLLDKISFAGREFRDFQIVNDPALVVAQYLLNKEIN